MHEVGIHFRCDKCGKIKGVLLGYERDLSKDIERFHYVGVCHIARILCSANDERDYLAGQD